MLATSREPLGVPGETAWPVPPLPVRERVAEPSLEQLGNLGAVRLFVERTRAEEAARYDRHRLKLSPAQAPVTRPS